MDFDFCLGNGISRGIEAGTGKIRHLRRKFSVRKVRVVWDPDYGTCYFNSGSYCFGGRTGWYLRYEERVTSINRTAIASARSPIR